MTFIFQFYVVNVIYNYLDQLPPSTESIEQQQSTAKAADHEVRSPKAIKSPVEDFLHEVTDIQKPEGRPYNIYNRVLSFEEKAFQ